MSLQSSNARGIPYLQGVHCRRPRGYQLPSSIVEVLLIDSLRAVKLPSRRWTDALLAPCFANVDRSVFKRERSQLIASWKGPFPTAFLGVAELVLVKGVNASDIGRGKGLLYWTEEE